MKKDFQMRWYAGKCKNCPIFYQNNIFLEIANLRLKHKITTVSAKLWVKGYTHVVSNYGPSLIVPPPLQSFTLIKS